MSRGLGGKQRRIVWWYLERLRKARVVLQVLVLQVGLLLVQVVVAVEQICMAGFFPGRKSLSR